MPLTISVNVGESVAIGGPATVKVGEKSGQAVRLVIDAEPSVPIKKIDAPPPHGASYGLSAARQSAAPGLGLKQEPAA